MIEETGRVVATDEHYAWVLTCRESVCQSCSARNGCGSRLLNTLGNGSASQVKVAKSVEVAVGDTVMVGMAEQGIIRAALMVYLVPLILMILCAVFADQLLNLSEPGIVLAGFSGMALGLFMVKILPFKLACNPVYHPQLLSKVSL